MSTQQPEENQPAVEVDEQTKKIQKREASSLKHTNNAINGGLAGNIFSCLVALPMLLAKNGSEIDGRGIFFPYFWIVVLTFIFGFSTGCVGLYQAGGNRELRSRALLGIVLCLTPLSVGRIVLKLIIFSKGLEFYYTG